ncbi:NAD(P)H-hydrate dehydratase [Robiginitalea sp. SC105]|uniref:NAD(P)H-hydrate dehydratase n=1 Tax=Robiginitalea sp. SC105 TaxID=2762332 RepID=UPI001639FA4A|nr:NAD(P)H-hydrate dehydratase [Robiginitalea sp. SC105]MBC2840239.1 NAD(P)H-hydrate dehydratase [Robiginitalea sp. SC105]
MKILNKDQSYQADQQTLAAQDISSTELMERAAVSIFNWLHNRLQGAPVQIAIFCGTGNNGGDGLALARHLAEHGYHLRVYLVNYSKKRSEDFLVNLERLKQRKVWPESLDESSALPDVSEADILVDAIFGIGLSRPPAPWVRELIAHLNGSAAFRLAIDLPSGLQMDAVPEFPEGVFRAEFTLTIGSPKLVLFLPQTGIYSDDFAVLDIGFDRAFMAGVPAEFEWIGKAEALSLLRPRERFTHKGNFGHVCMVGGSYGKIGAVSLSASACLHTGAGLVTAWVPRCGYLPLQTGLPEIMVQTCREEEWLDSFPEPDAGRHFGVGMGMGTGPQTREAFLEWLGRLGGPVVIDADGLNNLAAQPEALAGLPPGSILTPHPGELQRLIGEWKDDFEKLAKARDFAKKHQCILLIKGAYTVILGEGKGFVNSSGNPGMATAGSGDVLCGMLTALIAQGYPPLEAAVFGVYLHGRAGDLAAASSGQESLTARGIIRAIGSAFLDLKSVNPPPETGEGEES